MFEGIHLFSNTIYVKNGNPNILFRKTIRFADCYKRFRITQMLVNTFGDIIVSFLVVLIFAGIILSSCGVYITFKIQHKISLVLGPAITLVCILLAIVLNHLGDFPHKNSRQFHQFWNIFARKIEHKKKLKACPLLGFYWGPYGLATAGLGLTICDKIVNNAVTVLLLDALF